MTYLEYYKSLYEKYPEWDPGFVSVLDEMNLLDDIERVSGILVSLPKGASLKMMAEAIDPEHTYKTTCNTEKGAYRVLRLINRDRETIMPIRKGFRLRPISGSIEWQTFTAVSSIQTGIILV